MPILSLAALTILDAGPAGQIKAAASAGWRSVGLRLQPLLPSDEAVIGRPEREREVRNLLLDHEVQALEIGVFPVSERFDPLSFKPILDFSAEIGAAFLVAPIEDHDLRRRADRLGRFAEQAKRWGLRALVEFNPYSACKTLRSALQLLEDSEAEDAGLCLDVFHLFRSGGAPEDIDEAIRDRIALVHLCDAAPPQGLDEEGLRRESRTARRLPGEGVLPLGALFAALPRDVPLSLEAPSPRLTGLAADERARIALKTTERWLAKQERPPTVS